MLEVLRFIFSSFWIFAGCVVLLVVCGGVITDIARAVAQSIRFRKE